MKTAEKHPEEVEVKLTTLQPHPKQAEYFQDLTEAMLEDLARDIAANGVKERIDILPCGTILSGHQRVKACSKLGHTTIPAKVHFELEGDELATERFFIEANLNRRHMGKLEQARAYKQLRELSRKNGYYPRGKGDLRDILAERFGVSGRTLDRHMEALRAPRPVLDAVDRGQLPITEAIRISKLPRVDQEEIAERVLAGEEPREVAQEYGRRKGLGLFKQSSSGKTHSDADDAVERLQQAQASLEAVSMADWDASLLEQVQATLTELQAWCEECRLDHVLAEKVCHD